MAESTRGFWFLSLPLHPPNAVSPEVQQQNITLNSHLRVVPKSKIHGAASPCLLYASVVWCLGTDITSSLRAHVFWDVTPCHLMSGYQHFKGMYYLLLVLGLPQPWRLRHYVHWKRPELLTQDSITTWKTWIVSNTAVRTLDVAA
jgi:hypothetical protein